MKITEQQFNEAVAKIGVESVERIIRGYVEALTTAKPVGEIIKDEDKGIRVKLFTPAHELGLGTILYILPAVEKHGMGYEQYHAIRGGHLIVKSDLYFAARALLGPPDNQTNRKLFEDGFERGYDTANKA